MTFTRCVARCAGVTAAAGVGLLGYACLEARWPVLRHVTVPVLAPGESPLRILHLSDLHLTDHTQARVAWVRELASCMPDVVINTGDNLSFAGGLEPLTRALEPFLQIPGAFVLGDHDYHSTVFKLPTRYLRSDPRDADDPEAKPAPELPWREVRDLQSSGGWCDATNARGVLRVGWRVIDVVGVDDPHVERDVYPAVVDALGSDAEPTDALACGVAGPVNVPYEGVPVRAADGSVLRVGLTHAPYRRVLGRMYDDGVDVAFAGHTHGGQLCVPGYGALVTNCDLDTARASGLSRYPQRDAGLWLHVSAGLGTSPFTPVRIACRPEATLLTLVPSRDV